jgi:hypothetical protein
MHELGEILREAVRPIQAEAVAVSAQSDQHGCKIVLVHSTLCRIANLLSGYGAHRYLLVYSMGVCLWLHLQGVRDILFAVRTSGISQTAEWLPELICGLLLLAAASFKAAEARC